MFNKKGQGTIEYLVIIAVVIVIALIVVGILLALLGQGATIDDTSSKIAWQSTEPWAIIEWDLNSDEVLTIVLQNNSIDTLDLVAVSIGQGTNWTTGQSGISPKAKQTIYITGTGIASGAQYTFKKEDIYIDYNTSNIPNRRQIGVADILGTAS